MYNILANTSQNLALLSVAFAFIVLKDGAGDSDVVLSELRSTVATKIAKYAVPDQILVSGLMPLVRLHCSPPPPSPLPRTNIAAKLTLAVSFPGVDEGGRWLYCQREREGGREI